VTLTPDTFGGRIQDRAMGMVCPFCGAMRGHGCRTRSSGMPAQLHAARWAKARARLVSEGDGPHKDYTGPVGLA